MSFPARFTLVILAAFFLTSVSAALLASVFARSARALRVLSRLSPGALAAVRLLPAAASLAITALMWAPGYFKHEQRGELEEPGVFLVSLAAAGALILAMAAARAMRSFVTAARLRRAWLSSAEPVELAAGMPAFSLDLPFPLVAVLGAVRPRLFISGTVLKACSQPELTAIVQHERTHVSRRDNAVRLLMEASPDLLWRSRFNSRLVAEWHRAVEHRADDAASVKLDLASALVRVARLASESAPMALPASALYRGEGADTIEERVRRLAGAAPVMHAAWFPWRTLVLLGVCVLALASAAASGSAHAVLEVLVSRLP